MCFDSEILSLSFESYIIAENVSCDCAIFVFTNSSNDKYCKMTMYGN